MQASHGQLTTSIGVVCKPWLLRAGPQFLEMQASLIHSPSVRGCSLNTLKMKFYYKVELSLMAARSNQYAITFYRQNSDHRASF